MRVALRLGVIGVMLGASARDLSAQAPAGKRFEPARTADGRPDLQGVWNYSSATPLERPAAMKDKAVLSEAEAAALVKQSEAQRAIFDAAPRTGDVGAYNGFWLEFGTMSPDRRTGLITDPPDGRLPPMTPDAEKRTQARKDQLARPADGPEQRDASERCILGYNSGPPMSPVIGYNQNMQLVQTRDYVVIFMEMVHDARIVQMTPKPPLPARVRPWMGDSRGRWDGDTLVVQTTNFTDKVWSQYSGWNWASDENMKLTERFTLVGPDTLQYEFTVDDPTVWTKPWSAMYYMSRTKEQMFEYACHEANHGMVGIPRGARGAEGVALDKPKTP
jgi:hypothetical protein